MTPRLDLTDQDFFRDPAARITELRALGPVIRIKFPIVGKVWITTTYEMAGRVLKDSARRDRPDFHRQTGWRRARRQWQRCAAPSRGRRGGERLHRRCFAILCGPARPW